MKKLKLISIILICLVLLGCELNVPDKIGGNISNVIVDTEDKLIINFLDVGQGDCTFIQLSNNETMLIDTGEKEYFYTVESYIKKLGYNKIDYLIATHPHSDHIGGMSSIVNNFDIGKIYMPKASSNTSTYLNLLKSIQNKGLSVDTAKNGVNIISNEDLTIDIISPIKDEYDNLNNYSVIIKIVYKDRSFLFMGDAEKLVEEELENDINVDVIKVGHHGSDTSSSKDFVNKVSAKYAIISVGKDNSYGHPNNVILKRWEDSGASIYRTDLLETIILTTDGKGIKIENETSELETDDFLMDDQDIELINMTNQIEKGKEAYISIKGVSNTEYSIKVMYKSGPSSADGLENKVSDNEGNVTWKWKVSSNVTSGTYEIIISNKDTSKTFYYEIK